MSEFKRGDRVEFFDEDGSVRSGYVAERDVSPLTMMTRVRVVPTLVETLSKHRGEWVNVVDLLVGLRECVVGAGESYH